MTRGVAAQSVHVTLPQWHGNSRKARVAKQQVGQVEMGLELAHLRQTEESCWGATSILASALCLNPTTDLRILWRGLRAVRMVHRHVALTRLKSELSTSLHRRR